jgi:hypothetical protein
LTVSLPRALCLELCHPRGEAGVVHGAGGIGGDADSFRDQPGAQRREAAGSVAVTALECLAVRHLREAALVHDVAVVGELLLEPGVVGILRPHGGDGLVERELRERAHERAVEVVAFRIDVPAL